MDQIISDLKLRPSFQGVVLAARIVKPLDSQALVFIRITLKANCDGKAFNIQSFLGWAFPGLFFFYFCLFYLNVQLVDKTLPMLGFEVRISHVGCDCSTN